MRSIRGHLCKLMHLSRGQQAMQGCQEELARLSKVLRSDRCLRVRLRRGATSHLLPGSNTERLTRGSACRSARHAPDVP